MCIFDPGVCVCGLVGVREKEGVQRLRALRGYRSVDLLNLY